MSSEMSRRKILQYQKESANLQRDKARESESAANARRDAAQAMAAAARASSVSACESQRRNALRYEQNAAQHDKRVAEYEVKIARKQGHLVDAQKSLDRELESESRQRQSYEERRLRDNERKMHQVDATLQYHNHLHQQSQELLRRLSELPEKIVVLFLASNPLDANQLRLDEEVRSIQEMIRKSRHRDSVKLESCWAVRPLDVLQAINEHQPRIVHFSGHGSNQDEIIFQDDNGHVKPVTLEAIVQTMAAASAVIQLVFFNTCYSHIQAKAAAQKVGAAIGMNTSIGDEAARIFAAQFYSSIGFGLPLDRAFNQAKAALMLESIPEENTPELFISENLTAGDIYLIRPEQEAENA